MSRKGGEPPKGVIPIQCKWVLTKKVNAAGEAVKAFIEQLGVRRLISMPIPIMCDSQAAIAHSSNYVDRSRTKQIAMKYHFVRDTVTHGMIKLNYIPSNDNVADIFTKPLNRRQHQAHAEQMISTGGLNTTSLRGELVGMPLVMCRFSFFRNSRYLHSLPLHSLE
uniref:Reverse transcriptase Ty1/copia-type domain-containing protein n=1 Tax=Trichuris muris TaxID=70415 RepID=A0A5S6Q6H6_TRIMR